MTHAHCLFNLFYDVNFQNLNVCFPDNGEVYAWGSNKEGQLGILNESKLIPTKLELDFKISSISCGYYHSLALTGL